MPEGSARADFGRSRAKRFGSNFLRFMPYLAIDDAAHFSTRQHSEHLIMKALAFSLAYVLILSSAQVWGADMPALKASPGSSSPNISADGEAEDQVKPDLAILSLGAVDDRPTAAAAAVENARLSNNIVEAIKKLGVGAQDIRAENLELEPLFRERTDPKTNDVVERTFIGYRAFTMYRVQIHNVDDAPRIARQIVESGSNSYRGLTFLASDREMRFDALRAKAVTNALQRAELYAKSASLKLGDIVQIAPESGSFPGHSDQDLPPEKGGAAEVALSVPAEPGLESLHAKVRVTWELASQNASPCEIDKIRK
jgi:uncharacterized protein